MIDCDFAWVLTGNLQGFDPGIVFSPEFQSFIEVEFVVFVWHVFILPFSSRHLCIYASLWCGIGSDKVEKIKVSENAEIFLEK